MGIAQIASAIFLGTALTATATAGAKISITGTVTNGSGTPVSKCDVFFNKDKWITDESVHVTCDENGRYQAEIEPGRYNSFYVCDEEEYGKTKLEFWGWNLNLTESQTLDAPFDALEVYSLATWASNGGSNSIFASFRPMSLKKPRFYQKQVDDRSLVIFDILPSIDASSISASLDGVPIELIGYSWAYEKVGGCSGIPDELKGAGCHMPMIIAQFKKPKLKSGQHALRVRLTDSENGQMGEALTHFTSNNSGLGF